MSQLIILNVTFTVGVLPKPAARRQCVTGEILCRRWTWLTGEIKLYLEIQRKLQMKHVVFSSAGLSVGGQSLIKLPQTTSGSEARTTLVYYCRNASSTQMSAFFHSCFINTPIYHKDKHSFKTMSCSSLKCADTNKTGHERFSFSFLNILHWRRRRVELREMGKGQPFCPR